MGATRAVKLLPPSSLQSHVGFWLRFVSNHVSHAFKLKVETRGVTVAEWVVLRSIVRHGKRQSERNRRKAWHDTRSDLKAYRSRRRKAARQMHVLKKETGDFSLWS